MGNKLTGIVRQTGTLPTNHYDWVINGTKVGNSTLDWVIRKFLRSTLTYSDWVINGKQIVGNSTLNGL